MMTNLFILLVTWASMGQNGSQKIIFDVTSTDIKVHKSVMIMMDVMASNYPDYILEVVVYGEALTMLMKGRSTVAQEIAQYVNNEKVIFTACEVSMDLIFQVDKSHLLEGVGTVGNAVPDIVNKQKNGWGYIKTGS